MKMAGHKGNAQDHAVWRGGIFGKRRTRACVEKKTVKRL